MILLCDTGFLRIDFLEQKHPDLTANTWALHRHPCFHVGQSWITILSVTDCVLGFVAKQQNRNLDDVNKFCYFFLHRSF